MFWGSLSGSLLGLHSLRFPHICSRACRACAHGAEAHTSPCLDCLRAVVSLRSSPQSSMVAPGHPSARDPSRPPIDNHPGHVAASSSPAAPFDMVNSPLPTDHSPFSAAALKHLGPLRSKYLLLLLHFVCRSVSISPSVHQFNIIPFIPFPFPLSRIVQ